MHGGQSFHFQSDCRLELDKICRHFFIFYLGHSARASCQTQVQTGRLNEKAGVSRTIVCVRYFTLRLQTDWIRMFDWSICESGFV